MVDALHDGAAHAECDVDVTVEKLFTGYRLQAVASRAVVAAEAALRACGYEPRASPPAAARTPTRSSPTACRA